VIVVSVLDIEPDATLWEVVFTGLAYASDWGPESQAEAEAMHQVTDLVEDSFRGYAHIMEIIHPPVGIVMSVDLQLQAIEKIANKIAERLASPVTAKNMDSASEIMEHIASTVKERS
jgi:dihydroorotate dehydrogenase